MSSRIYTIPARPVVHNDTLFHSTLESQWARFFDRRGIAWSYEPQGFRLPCRPHQLYYPDFLLKGIGYAEVKPDASEIEEGFTPMEYSLCAELCIRTGQRVLMLVGGPGNDPHPCFEYRDGDAHLEDWSF